MWRRLVSLVRRRSDSYADAEDYVQAAYAKLVEQSQRHVIANPEGFVLRAATNLAISDHRMKTRHASAHGDCAVKVILQPPAPSQHEALAARERLRVVEQAIAELPPKAREVFVLQRIDGLTYSEIAQVKGISVSAVEKHMARSLAHLAIKLSEFGRKRG